MIPKIIRYCWFDRSPMPDLAQKCIDLLRYHAFAGIEGSKYKPVMMGVCASEPHGEWVTEMLNAYSDRHFIKMAGGFDLRTNVQFVTEVMVSKGFLQNGIEQDYHDLHVFPVDYFCPRQTTGEFLRTANTYCDHRGIGSWAESGGGWKAAVGRGAGSAHNAGLDQAERKIFG